MRRFYRFSLLVLTALMVSSVMFTATNVQAQGITIADVQLDQDNPPPPPESPSTEPESDIDPVVTEPVVEEPVVEEPVVEEPVVEEPVVEEPVVEEPVVEEPVAEEPVAEEPVAEEPVVVQEPVVQEPVVQEPVVQEPVVQEPVVQEPIFVQPVGKGADPVAPPAQIPPTSVETDSMFAVSAFERVWQQAGTIQQSMWLWGQGAISDGMYEPYLEGKNGVRLVQYFDKSRMEINNVAAPQDQQIVTSGRLVVEMIEGKVQIGDNAFETLAPSEQAIAGDPLAVNASAPTYSSFRNVSYPVHAVAAPNRVGEIVSDVIARNGSVTQDSAFATYGVTIGSYSEVLGHNVPQVFTTFFTQQGMDALYVVGLPISEPYWAKVMVGGVEKDVLIQAFERRVLTYTPDNAAAWQVEMGNVGQHYMNWRYPADNLAIR